MGEGVNTHSGLALTVPLSPRGAPAPWNSRYSQKSLTHPGSACLPSQAPFLWGGKVRKGCGHCSLGLPRRCLLLAFIRWVCAVCAWGGLITPARAAPLPWGGGAVLELC